MIEVIRAGPLTSIQDLGRVGLRHLGIGQSGVLDSLALCVANRLVGNTSGAAGVEITIGPTVLRITRNTRIALTGADFAATLDDEPVSAWWSLPVRAGQCLTLRAPCNGMRAYLAVAGGIDVTPVLGSRSTDLQAGFGGLGGRVLCDGDCLPIGGSELVLGPDTARFGVKSPMLCRFGHLSRPSNSASATVAAHVLRVFPGPEYASFSPTVQATFWASLWRITPNSNRMGYRLSGPALECEDQQDLLSHAVLPGTIQVPPNGQPIVLMADAQTTGGYPKIGTVISADLWRLAQARLNANLCFVPVSLDEARQALREIDQYLRQIDLAVKMRRERLPRGDRPGAT